MTKTIKILVIISLPWIALGCRAPLFSPPEAERTPPAISSTVEAPRPADAPPKQRPAWQGGPITEADFDRIGLNVSSDQVRAVFGREPDEVARDGSADKRVCSWLEENVRYVIVFDAENRVVEAKIRPR